MAGKPSLNFFILIRNWHRVLTRWKISLSYVNEFTGFKGIPFLWAWLARLWTGWVWGLRHSTGLCGCWGDAGVQVCSLFLTQKSRRRQLRLRTTQRVPNEWRQHPLLAPGVPGLPVVLQSHLGCCEYSFSAFQQDSKKVLEIHHLLSFCQLYEGHIIICFQTGSLRLRRCEWAARVHPAPVGQNSWEFLHDLSITDAS